MVIIILIFVSSWEGVWVWMIMGEVGGLIPLSIERAVILYLVAVAVVAVAVGCGTDDRQRISRAREVCS